MEEGIGYQHMRKRLGGGRDWVEEGIGRRKGLGGGRDWAPAHEEGIGWRKGLGGGTDWAEEGIWRQHRKMISALFHLQLQEHHSCPLSSRALNCFDTIQKYDTIQSKAKQNKTKQNETKQMISPPPPQKKKTQTKQNNIIQYDKLQCDLKQ